MLDKKALERELLSMLVSSLHMRLVISEDHISGACLLLVASLEDLKLDVPKAEEFLAYYVAHALVDRCLPAGKNH